MKRKRSKLQKFKKSQNKNFIPTKKWPRTAGHSKKSKTFLGETPPQSPKMDFHLEGGGFSQDFCIFLIFWNSCSSGPFFFGMKFMFLDFLDFLQFRAFFVKTLPEPGFFFWNEVNYVFFGLRGGGGVVSPRTSGFFGVPAVLGPFFFGIKFLLLDFLDFLQFRACFAKALPKPGFFFLEWGLFFLAFEGGVGGFSQNFWIFGIFLNSCSSGPFFLEWNFCFWIFCSFERFFLRPMHLTRICLVIRIQLAVVISPQILLLLSVLSSVN